MLKRFIAKTGLRRSQFVLIAVCMAALICTACGSIDTLFNTILAVLGGINIVLASIGAVLAPAEVQAIEAGVTMAEDGVTALKNLVDSYEQDKTKPGAVDSIQAAIAAVKQNLAGLLAAGKIKNATLQGWIGKIVNLVGTVVDEIVTDILPVIQTKGTIAALESDKETVKSLDSKIKAMTAKLKADHDAALNSSGLSADTIHKVEREVNRKSTPNLGPVRV